jgi:putative ABC transport system permease protein
MGTLYGSIIACGFSYMIYQGLSEVQEGLWRVPWTAIGIAGAAALLIGYLSVLSPMARLKKENLIDVVREDF